MSVVASLSEVLPAEALGEPASEGALGGLAEGAEAVVHPRSTEEVVETVRWASANDVGVLTVGSGARVRGAPEEGRFILLATDRLTGFEIYEPADVTLTARAGTPMGEIRSALAEHRQWLPFDPPHALERTLGGLVASGESGPAATGYGELRNHVLGATVVCGDGRVLHLGGRVVKNVAGFDLLRPVVGSRGRLGVVTSVCMRAFPVPAEDRVLVHRAADLGELAEVARAVRTAPVLPVSLVAYGPAAALGGGAALVVRLHGARPTVDADQATLETHAGVTFERPPEAEALAAAVGDHAESGPLVLRLSVLPSRLFEALAAAREVLGELAVHADACGGTARIAPARTDVDAVRRLRDAVEGLGGALSVRSADVASEAASAASEVSAPERALAHRLERVFDPTEVFWPCRT